jgi:hypothetical protein
MVIMDVIRASGPSIYPRTRSLPFQYSTHAQVSETITISILSLADVLFHI